MPDGLRLDEREEPAQAGVAVPVRVGLGPEHARDDPRGRALEVGRDGRRRARDVERVDVAVSGEHGRELDLPSREDVDDSSRHVGGGQHLGEGDGWERAVLAREDDDGAARDERGHEDAHETEEGRRAGCDDARRLRYREVEVGPGDGIGRSGDPGELVRPPRVPDDTVYRYRLGDLTLGRRVEPLPPATAHTNCPSRSSSIAATR